MCINGHIEIGLEKRNNSCLFDIFLIPSHLLMNGDGVIEI